MSDLKETLPNGDAKITLDDVCDTNEYLAVKAENEYQAMKSRETEKEHQNLLSKRK